MSWDANGEHRSEAAREVRYSPLWQLTLAWLREFYRKKGAVLGVYGVPLMLAIALGLAFGEQTSPVIRVDVVDWPSGTPSQEVIDLLEADGRFLVERHSWEEAQQHLQHGKIDLIVTRTESGFLYGVEPNRSESRLARQAVENVLLRDQLGDTAYFSEEQSLDQQGGRYIDFLVPGLIGMNLMAGGLYGVGYLTVDFRIRNLLKRFLATPMRRTDYLFSLMLSRLICTVTEVLLLLVITHWVFGVTVAGNILALMVVIVLGGACFCGLGLLIASRATTIEVVGALMNLIMLPMYIVSGVFFSSERFPEVFQPIIQALPLTALNDAMRGVMLEGHGLLTIAPDLLILLAWTSLSFALALRWFRWR